LDYAGNITVLGKLGQMNIPKSILVEVLLKRGIGM